MVDETSREAAASDERGQEICSCGHRASSHVARKYSCQTPGGDKGFCSCMRFIPGKLLPGTGRQVRPKPKK